MAVVTVTITSLRLNLAADLTQVLSFPFQQSAASSPGVLVTTQQFADGGVRLVRQPGRQSIMQYAIACVSPGDRQLLEFDWVGQELLVRDDRGRKFWGFYVAPQITDHAYDDQCDVSLTISEITRTEGV